MTPTQERAAEAELQPEREIGIVGGKAGPGRGHKTNDNNKSFYGTSTEYLTDVIARDHPAIYDGMLRGEYRSQSILVSYPSQLLSSVQQVEMTLGPQR